MISVRQIKAGRSMLNWSAAELAKVEVDVGPATTFVGMRWQAGVPSGNTCSYVEVFSLRNGKCRYPIHWRSSGQSWRYP